LPRGKKVVVPPLQQPEALSNPAATNDNPCSALVKKLPINALLPRGKKVVVPPLQQPEALSDPAATNDIPRSAVVKKFAEIMFLVKNSPTNSKQYQEIATDAFAKSKANWKLAMRKSETGFR
jgi:hypothetical protein